MSDDTQREERGALVVFAIAALVVLVVGAPCFIYFGIGLFQGVHVLRTGDSMNPARRPAYEKLAPTPERRRRSRPARYDRAWPDGGVPLPARPEP